MFFCNVRQFLFIITVACVLAGSFSFAGARASNNPPVVLVSPGSLNAAVGLTMPITASFSDEDPASVTFKWAQDSGPAGGIVFLDNMSSTPFLYANAAGTYAVRVTATDNAGQVDFDILTIDVSPIGLNSAPIVNAGADKLIYTLSVTLDDALMQDDGNPKFFPITTNWSKISGPGAVSFTMPDSTCSTYAPSLCALKTSVTFSDVGIYILRLTVSDTHLASFDEVQIISAPMPLPSAPATTSVTTVLPLQKTEKVNFPKLIPKEEKEEDFSEVIISIFNMFFIAILLIFLFVMLKFKFWL